MKSNFSPIPIVLALVLSACGGGEATVEIASARGPEGGSTSSGPIQTEPTLVSHDYGNGTKAVEADQLALQAFSCIQSQEEVQVVVPPGLVPGESAVVMVILSNLVDNMYSGTEVRTYISEWGNERVGTTPEQTLSDMEIVLGYGGDTREVVQLEPYGVFAQTIIANCWGVSSLSSISVTSPEENVTLELVEQGERVVLEATFTEQPTGGEQLGSAVEWLFEPISP